MRLLNVKTMKMEQFFDEEEFPKYAILSHTWGDEEILFSDMNQVPGIPGYVRRKRGFSKIDYTCQQACKEGINYAWIDTCCIDKTSSAELSEAINSMYKWYERSEICFAYLEDTSLETQEEHLKDSRWFTRGWTLQELLAPREIDFFGSGWELLGSKTSLSKKLAAITGIDVLLLQDRTNIASFSVAVRMSWAADRVTTRLEDMAYCLLGIFDVNMPLLYGEGNKAFFRLQEEILKLSQDQSLLVWTPNGIEKQHSRHEAFASHPNCFKNARKIVSFPSHEYVNANQMIPHGLEITLPLLRIRVRHSKKRELVALLNCHYSEDYSGCIGILLSESLGSKTYHRKLEAGLMVVSAQDQADADASRIIIGHDELAYAQQSREWFSVCWVKSETALSLGLKVQKYSFREGLHGDRLGQVTWNKLTQTMKFPASNREDHQHVAFFFRADSAETGFIIFVAFGPKQHNDRLRIDDCWIAYEMESDSYELGINPHTRYVEGINHRGPPYGKPKSLIIPPEKLDLDLASSIAVKAVLKEEFSLNRYIFTLEVTMGQYKELVFSEDNSRLYEPWFGRDDISSLDPVKNWRSSRISGRLGSSSMFHDLRL